jgi:sensor c-di-GMP phosphodiesterase-like protein
MSSEQEQIRLLAERVARRLSENASQQEGALNASNEHNDVAALRAGLAQIQQRLAHIESHIAHDDSCDNPVPEASSAPRTTRMDARRTAQETRESGGQSSPNPTTPMRSMWLSGTYVPATAHPSEERFGIGEAVSELVDYFKREKTCTIEPGEKPCDHCAMCSSRGF